jgi:hypothetical protein
MAWHTQGREKARAQTSTRSRLLYFEDIIWLREPSYVLYVWLAAMPTIYGRNISQQILTSARNAGKLISTLLAKKWAALSLILMRFRLSAYLDAAGLSSGWARIFLLTNIPCNLLWKNSKWHNLLKLFKHEHLGLDGNKSTLINLVGNMKEKIKSKLNFALYLCIGANWRTLFEQFLKV